MKLMGKKLLIIILLCISVLSVIMPSAVKAATMTYVDLAHEGYESLVTMSLDELSEEVLLDTKSRQYCARTACVHSPSQADGGNKVIAIVDVNYEGAGYNVATIWAPGRAEPVTVTDDVFAALAYVAASAEKTDGGSDHTYSDKNNAWKHVWAFLWFWETKEGRKKVEKAIEMPLPNNNNQEDGFNNVIAKEAKAYADAKQLENGNVCSARILVTSGDSTQAIAILSGIMDGETGGLSVFKYIPGQTPDRAEFEENDKQDYPLHVSPMDQEITYNIDITNKCDKPMTVSIVDTFDYAKEKGGLKFVGDSTWTKKAVNKYTKTMTIPAKTKQTVNITLKTYSNVLADIENANDLTMEELENLLYTEVYLNKVVVTGKVGDKEYTDESNEYVYVGVETEGELKDESVEPQGNIEKYITAVNGVTIHGRDGLSSEDKYKTPIVVSKGDEVTYTIKVTNTTSTDMYNCEISDSPESGISISNTSGLTGFSLDGGDTYTTTVTGTVTKSNLYLYNLENTANFTYAEYTKVVKKSYTYKVTLSDGTVTTRTGTRTYYYPNTPVSQSSINRINSGNMKSDYVRLRELVISGTVWQDQDKDGKMNNEVKLQNIPVELFDVKENKVWGRRQTTSEGTYTFTGFYKGTDIVKNGDSEYYPNASKYSKYGDTVTASSKQYYVKFNYDGVVYMPTVYSGKTNLNSGDCSINSAYKTDSNATERPSERSTFNDALETISYNKGNSKALEFEKTGHESKLKWTDSTTMSSYSFINGETIQNLFLLSDGETEYLEYINLGLYEREKLDLRVTKDLLESNVYINEQDMKYNFAKLNTNNLYYKGGPAGTEEKYEYELYKSDYAYRSSLYYHDEVKNLKAGTELEVDLLYKVVIYNESDTTYGDTFAKINEVADFYSKQLVLDEVYMLNGSTKLPLTVESSSSYNNTGDYTHTGTYNLKYQFDSADNPQSYSTITSTNNPYNTVFIKGNDLTNKVLSSGDTVEIFLKYHLDKSAETADVNDIDKWLYYGDLINVAQISAYSTYESDTSTTPKGLVDIDSNAGNVVNTNSADSANINDPATYDDNTFRSFTVLSIKDKVREITGFVFDDTRSEKLGGDYNYYTGNGYYTDSANPNPVTGGIDSINSEAVAFFNNSSMIRYTGNDLAEAKQIWGADLSAFNIIDNMNELIQDIEADRKLSGMTVQLIEVVLDPTTNIMYEETLSDLAILTSGNVVEQTQTTGDKGHYVLSSFIPATYVVRFKSGDAFNGDITYNSLTHNGQDYKSTTYLLDYTDDAGNTFILNSDIDRDYNAGGAGSALTAEEYNDIKYAALTEKNKSDARGNELRRLEIMSFSEVMTNEKAELLKYPTYLEHGTGKILKSASGALAENLQKFIETTEYFADTVTVKLGVENKADTKNRIGEEVDYRDFSEIALRVENIDYGLTYRPENLVKLDKDIKSIKLTTPDSSDPLLYIEYNRNGNVISSVGAENLQSINNIGNVQGFRYINVDEDILQGARLETEYYITVKNIGEVDIMDKSLNEQGGASVILNKLYADSIASEINLPNSTKLNYTNASRLIDKVYNSASGNYKYGILVGEVYYQGVNVSTADLIDLDVVTLTVNQVLDWVDNDARIELDNNNTENRYWVATGEKELLELGLIDDKMLYNAAGLSSEEISAGISNSRYKDELDRYYTTTERKNLAINIDVQKNENNEIVSNPNPELIKAIYPVYAGKVNSMTSENALKATTGYIVIKTDAVLGGDNESEMMTYDNIAEIVKFTSPVGRRTNFLSTIGNIGSKSSSPKTSITDNPEPDSYMAEIIRLTPPTGASRFNLFVAGNVSVIFISITVLMLAVIVYILKYALRGKVGKSKFYK